MAPFPGQEEGLNRMMKIVNSFLARPDCSPFSEPVDWRGLELYDYPKMITHMMDLGTVKRKLERHQYRTIHECAQDIRLVWSNCMAYNADGSDFWLLAKSLSRKFEDRYRKIKQEFEVGDNLNFDANDNQIAAPTQESTSGGGNKAEDTAKPTTTSVTTKSGRKSTSTSPVPPSSNTATTANNAATTNSNSLASSSSLSLDVRAKFAANLFFLSGSELGHVITELECHCPEALEPLPPPSITPPPSIIPKNHWMEINVDVIPPKLFHLLQKYVTDKVGSMASPMGNNNNTSKKQRTSTDSAMQHQVSSVSASKNVNRSLDDEFDEPSGKSSVSPANAAASAGGGGTATLNRSNSNSKKRKK